MIGGFVVTSIVAVIFLLIGISCRREKEAVGFFTFVNPPKVKNVKAYNHAVSILWFVAAGVIAFLGIAMLFLEQNSPLFILIVFAVMILVIAMMVAYIKIEGKYKK